MASIQEPEVQLAQRLASNEKPVRTKAIKKLRKYINVRSQSDIGGFTGDELLKLWKGLFYCLWMQDKPLLQEELSNQISTLIHSFHHIDSQLLYLESFLQTFKREWTGIDRLRMDKFFQLVRFMFRQTFEMLKRKNWESSLVGRFLELLNAQLLQSSSGAPCGLQFHILDLYMTELAAVGSAELTADQNLIFIEPFCKTAAKTKDRSLFRAICNSLLGTIIDQAPFAIDDLMKEVKGAEASDSDSGQASEEDDQEDQPEEKISKPVSKKGTWKQMNGNISNEAEEDDSDELLHLEDSDSEGSCDEDDEEVGPVLQFDYAALADKLFALASRNSTPSRNRQRLYKIINVLRDLNEGIFPQDECPEEVSTDEDDDMFCSRKRMKRGGRPTKDDEEGGPAAKKRKKREASALNKQNEASGEDDNEPADLTANDENKNKKKKKRKKKKKAVQSGSAAGEENADGPEQTVAPAQSGNKETEGGPECSQDTQKEAQTQGSLSSIKVTEAATPESQSETLLLSEVKKQPTVIVIEDTSEPTPCTSDKDQSEKETSELKPEVMETAEEEQTPDKTEPEMSPEAQATVSGKKKKKKGLKAKLQTDEIVAELQVNGEEEIIPASSEESAEKQATTTPETDATAPAKKKKKKVLKAKKNVKEVEGESQVHSVSTEADSPSILCEDSEEACPTVQLVAPTDSTNPCSKKGKKKNLKANEVLKVEAEAQLEVEGKHTSAGEETSQDAAAVPLKKKTKKKGKQGDATLDESTVTPLNKKRKKNKKESEAEEEGAAVEAPQSVDAEITMTTPAKKKKKKLAAAQLEVKDQTQSQVVGSVDAELSLGEAEAVSSSGKPAKKKKRKIPVTFEYEVDELEAAAQEATSINGLAEEETGVKAKPGSAKKSQKKTKASPASASDFMTFQSNATVPTPLFCKTKKSPKTPLSSKKVKKNQTPKSESKKVTFGLKNNKTAEFRKTDRSLLVSPDGSSRVPFDPEQKPKFGVLKSPPTPVSARKTPKANKKILRKSTPKRRPTAADFF
ncbi:uncharacterized protein rrp1 isoform X1 [Sebastes fasciatus]|uniref:uncharacterized protein rrp1 isoform X1 n=1 Tax=Sebastes fasciatus TaxID=394691 RepID=UPI003D9E32FB